MIVDEATFAPLWQARGASIRFAVRLNVL